MRLTSDWSRGTETEGVPGEPVRAGADGDVVRHSADGRHSAGAGARVATLGADTSLVHGAVRAHQTLGATAVVRVALELGQALAHGERVLHSAASVGPTRGWVAGVGGGGGSRRHCYNTT